MLLCLQLEEEIATLRSVLDAKVKEASELKQKLGITPLGEFKDDFKHGIQVIKESETLVFLALFQHIPNQVLNLFDLPLELVIKMMYFIVLYTHYIWLAIISYLSRFFLSLMLIFSGDGIIR